MSDHLRCPVGAHVANKKAHHCSNIHRGAPTTQAATSIVRPSRLEPQDQAEQAGMAIFSTTREVQISTAYLSTCVNIQASNATLKRARGLISICFAPRIRAVLILFRAGYLCEKLELWIRMSACTNNPAKFRKKGLKLHVAGSHGLRLCTSHRHQMPGVCYFVRVCFFAALWPRIKPRRRTIARGPGPSFAMAVQSRYLCVRPSVVFRGNDAFDSDANFPHMHRCAARLGLSCAITHRAAIL